MAATVVKVAKVAAPIVISILTTVGLHLLKKLKERVKRPPRPPNKITREEMIRRARDELGMELAGFVNFAFCGPRGSGKSSLINSLRGLQHPDPPYVVQNDGLGSAPTGEVETTRETRCYGFPTGHESEFVRFWDHPGCGTQNHPVESYFDDKVLYAYDCVLLVTYSGLGEYEGSIIKQARIHGTDVVIVVNQADLRVNAKKRLRPPNAGPLNENDRSMLIQETIDEIKQNINHDLNDIQHDQVPVFVVSSWEWYDYQVTGSPDAEEMAMEIRPLFEHLLNAALLRRAA